MAGLGIELGPPTLPPAPAPALVPPSSWSRVAFPTMAPPAPANNKISTGGGKLKLKRSHQSDDMERRPSHGAIPGDTDAEAVLAARRRKTMHEEASSQYEYQNQYQYQYQPQFQPYTQSQSQSRNHVPPRMHSRPAAIPEVEYVRPQCPSQASLPETLVAMRSSRAMEGLLLAEVGASMVEMDKLSSGGGAGVRASQFRQGKTIEPGAVTPLASVVPPVNAHQGAAVGKARRPRLYSEHVRNLSADQSLFRQGTLLSSAPTSALRRAEQLSMLLGNGSGKVRSGAVVPPPPPPLSRSSLVSLPYSSRNKSRSSLKDMSDAVTFEQGRSRVRVALDIELENNVVVEGGYISGTLLIRVHPKRKDDILKLGGGKIRIAGFEVAPKNEDRCIFYQVAAPLSNISQDYGRMFTLGVDDEGFGSVIEGIYGMRFVMQIPLVGNGGKPRGVLNSRSGSGAAIKYIIIASIKVVDPGTGKRSIAHFYRDCEVWPALDPIATLAPAPDPMLARAAKKLFMGGDGTLALTASMHRSTWVAGQPVHVRLRIVNETKKSVRSIAFAVVRTTTLFKLSGGARHRAVGYGYDDDMDEEGTNTHERRVAEVVLTAGQKGAKGRASAKGWWTGVGPGEMRNVTHSIMLPSDALTIPRARLVEVDYAVRVALAVSSLAGNSEAVHVTLPIRVVNFISLDPPPSEPTMSGPATSVIELDTPRQDQYADLSLEEAQTESLSDLSTDGHCGEEIVHRKPREVLKRVRANTLPRNAKIPSPMFPSAYTVHDLGSMEDADNLDGMFGDIPGSTSILEETDITLEVADSGYSEGGCSRTTSGFSHMRRTKSGYLPMRGRSVHSLEEEYHDSFEDGAEEGDIGSDEELEKMVGCASARIDACALPYFAHPEQMYRTRSSELLGRGNSALEPIPAHHPVPDPPRAVRGPRNMVPVKREETQTQMQQERTTKTSIPYDQPIPAPQRVLAVTNPSNYVFTESPESMYSSGNSGGPTPTHGSASTSPSKRLRSVPSKPIDRQHYQHHHHHHHHHRSRSSGLPVPSAWRSLTDPTDATGSSHDSGYSSSRTSLSPSPPRAIAGLPLTTVTTAITANDNDKDKDKDKAIRMSPVRARIAALEMKSLEQDVPANQYGNGSSIGISTGIVARPSYVSRSLTTNAVHSLYA